MYSKDDFDLIKDKLNDIEKKAKKYYQDNFEEPTPIHLIELFSALTTQIRRGLGLVEHP